MRLCYGLLYLTHTYARMFHSSHLFAISQAHPFDLRLATCGTESVARLWSLLFHTYSCRHVHSSSSIPQAHPFDLCLATCGTESVVRLWSPEAEQAAYLTSRQMEDLAMQAEMEDELPQVIVKKEESSSVSVGSYNVVKRPCCSRGVFRAFERGLVLFKYDVI